MHLAGPSCMVSSAGTETSIQDVLIPAVQWAAREASIIPAQLAGRTCGQRLIHTAPRLRAIAEVPLAQTGEGIKECELTQWLVKVRHGAPAAVASTSLTLSTTAHRLSLSRLQEGDEVAEFDPLCEVQSDKATVQITSQYAGRVARLRHAEGDMVQVRGAPGGCSALLHAHAPSHGMLPSRVSNHVSAAGGRSSAGDGHRR